MRCVSETSVFVTTACPLCSLDSFRLVRENRYPKDLSLEEIKSVYRASSDSQLLDQLVECESCSLTFVNPRVNETFLIEGYESTIDPKFVAQNAERVETFRRLLKKIAGKIAMPSGANGKTILDVGCAGGAFLVAARDFGFETYGIEPSQWLAESGRQQYGLDVRQGVLEADTFPENSFDVISLWDVIEHVASPLELLATIRANLRANGFLLVNYPDYGSVAARLLGEKWPFLLSVHLLYYTRRTIRLQLERAGFEVKFIQPHWQSLKLGYILERMRPYFGWASVLGGIVKSTGLSEVPIRYNMGQTLVIAQKAVH